MASGYEDVNNLCTQSPNYDELSWNIDLPVICLMKGLMSAHIQNNSKSENSLHHLK